MDAICAFFAALLLPPSTAKEVGLRGPPPPPPPPPFDPARADMEAEETITRSRSFSPSTTPGGELIELLDPAYPWFRSIMIRLQMSLRALAMTLAGPSHENTWHMYLRVALFLAT
jgi:hypothetical protein